MVPTLHHLCPETSGDAMAGAAAGQVRKGIRVHATIDALKRKADVSPHERRHICKEARVDRGKHKKYLTEVVDAAYDAESDTVENGDARSIIVAIREWSTDRILLSSVVAAAQANNGAIEALKHVITHRIAAHSPHRP
mmetsp:Transcript_17186/g.37088  ORF Transcript_17186/g.37088 Transcript_17186/m.37088 type:complete len:138 (+) Transcript_17186:54-467(+)